MKYGFSLVVRGNDATPETFAVIAERAEALDIDSLWLSAHVIVPPQGDSHYANVPGRKYPPTWLERYWEPFTILGYLSGVTRKITLGTSVVVLPMHNPFEVAKQVAEIDNLSGGRFVFGIGVGWFKAEFDVLGQNFRNRGKRTDEALELIQRLWAEDPVSFQGRYYNVDSAHFAPKPITPGGPPIWVAGNSTAALRRTARFGTAFHPVNPSYDALVSMRKELDGLLDEHGRARDAVSLAVKAPMVFNDDGPVEGMAPTVGRSQDIIDAVRRFQELGSEHFVFDVSPETRQQALDTMERFAQEVRPHL